MQPIAIIVLVIIAILFLCKSDNEGFYFRSPPLAYDADACGRMCDNTDGCNSYYYDPTTRSCWMNSFYRYGDLYYPLVNTTYAWTPSRFRYGKYFGDSKGGFRAKLKKH